MIDARQFMAFQIGWANAKYMAKQLTRKQRDAEIEKYRQILKINHADLDLMKKQLVQCIVNVDKMVLEMDKQ